MSELVQIASVSTVGTGMAVCGMFLLMLRYRITIDWTPDAGTEGNKIYALVLEAVDRKKSGHKIAAHIHVVVRK